MKFNKGGIQSLPQNRERMKIETINVRGTMNALNAYESVMFAIGETKDSYIRHTASKLKRDTGKEFKVNYFKGIGTRVTRIA